MHIQPLHLTLLLKIHTFNLTTADSLKTAPTNMDSIEENAGATDHTGGENPADFRGEEEKGLSSRASSPDRRTAISNPPATWLERFSPSFLSTEANLADLDRNTTANLADNQAAIAIRVEQSLPPLCLARPSA